MAKKPLEEKLDLDIQFDKRGGLVPVVVQDFSTREVLMLAYVNRAAYKKTVRIGYATFWSTSRNKLWTKGKTSGDLLRMKEIKVDCDKDALLYLVEPLGAGACHSKNAEGKARYSCFYRRVKKGKLEFIEGMC